MTLKESLEKIRKKRQQKMIYQEKKNISQTNLQGIEPQTSRLNYTSFTNRLAHDTLWSENTKDLHNPITQQQINSQL